jgi:membrane protein required for colicin V production
MPITLLDGILVGITLVSGVLAMVRGFSREVLSVASWAAAAFAAFTFYKSATFLVKPYFDDQATPLVFENEALAQASAAGAIFLVTLIIVSIITMKIADFIIDSRIGALDRTLGFLFGAARGVLLMVVAMLFFNWLAPNNQEPWVANAKSLPLLKSMGERLVAMLPEDPEATIEKLKSGGAETPEPEAGAPADGEAKPADPAKPAVGTNG